MITRAVKLFVSRVAQRFGYYVGAFPPTTDRLDAHLGMLLSGLRINCVLDVGAQYGQFASLVRGTGYTGRIVSFEPVPGQYERLAAAASADAEWFVRPFAISSEDGEKPFNVRESGSLSSFAEPSHYGREQFTYRMGVVDRPIVPVRSIDSVLPEVTKGIDDLRLYLKIDAQGHDLAVMQGASKTLESVLAMQSEVAIKPIYEGVPPMADALSAFGKFGFDLSGVFPIRMDTHFRAVELDCVMVRANA